MARITIADVAREAGVSTMTVSRVLNNKGEISDSTREKVQQIISRLNYRPSMVARSLASNSTRTLGLLVPDIANPFFPEIARGAEDVAWEHGFSLILCNTVEDQEREKRSLQLLEDKRVDGIVACSPRLPDDELIPLLERHPASVLVNRTAPSSIAGMIRRDDAYGAMRAVHHLLADERQALCLLAGPTYSHGGKQRIRGFTSALEATGHSVEPESIITCSPDEAGGYEAAKRLLETRLQVNGLVCYNDLVALGAIQACDEKGMRVPGDIAIVGCDDIRLASLATPALTTLRISLYELGANAVTMLLERMGGNRETDAVVIKPELIVRASAP
ncbi:MAG: LacI family DNA-binding transcriptional regulator [Trueperaceae bacterium]